MVADIPGLVQGASEGKGLGHRFLRHIVRCRALVLVVDLSADDPSADLDTLTDELAAYDPELAERPAIIVGSKTDLVDQPAVLAAELHPATLPVSAVTGEGLEALLERLGLLAKEGEDLSADRAPFVVLRPGRPRFTIEREDDGGWRVSGRGVERWVMETDMDDDRQIERLQRRLIREGVERRLVAMGARTGQDVRIRDLSFEFLPDRKPGEPAQAEEEE